MARKRMIDPDIWQSEDFSRLSVLGRLLFIGLFSNADDEGRGRANAVYIKSTVFPYDEKLRVTDIIQTLSEIGSTMSITFYSHNGSEFFSLDHWSKWQKVEKPKPSNIPPPTDIPEASGTNRGRVGDESRLIEKNRKEENISPTSPGGECVVLNDVFDATYAKYPRKEGKAKGKQAYISYLSGGREVKGAGRVKLNHQQIFVAVQEYAEQCAGKDPQYIQFFDTFMHSTVLDLVEKTRSDYEAVMAGKYGEEWRDVRYEYA